MTIADLKGHLLTRRANLESDLRARRQAVTCIESDLIRARSEADTTHGALQATNLALADLDKPDTPSDYKAPGKPA